MPLALAVLPAAVLLYRYWALGFTMAAWGEGDIGDLRGRVALVTGANTGLGFETARQFAEHGARVVLGCRNLSKCQDARSHILARSPGADVTALRVDLAEPDSVDAFAKEFLDKFDSLDYLINNAGIMGTVQKRNSRGWESQFATNHLGHFILTGRLMPVLRRSKARIVNHSSLYASQFAIRCAQACSTHPASRALPSVNLTDWNWQDREYCPWAAYAQSKRANLYFTSELNRRYAHTGQDSGFRP